jgi:hypothetical protein
VRGVTGCAVREIEASYGDKMGYESGGGFRGG